jgi:hypothetical protein
VSIFQDIALISLSSPWHGHCYRIGQAVKAYFIDLFPIPPPEWEGGLSAQGFRALQREIRKGEGYVPEMDVRAEVTRSRTTGALDGKSEG